MYTLITAVGFQLHMWSEMSLHTCLSEIGCDDVVGPEGMEKFCEDIGVEPENVRLFLHFGHLDEVLQFPLFAAVFLAACQTVSVWDALFAVATCDVCRRQPS